MQDTNEDQSDDSFNFSTTPKKVDADKKSKTPIRFSKTGESMYNKGKEFLSNAEQKRKEFATTEHSFKPKINTKSEKLLQNALKEGRNPREIKPKDNEKEEMRKIEEEEEKKIKPKGDIKGFIERNYTNSLTKSKALEKNEDLDSECTFKPKVCDKSKELVQNQHYDLFKQAEDLKKKKEDKIEEAKRKKEAAELDGCTFKPKITKNYGNYSPQGKTKKTAEVSFGYAKSRQHRLSINT